MEKHKRHVKNNADESSGGRYVNVGLPLSLFGPQ